MGKREPASDIDTGVVDSLKVLDPDGRLEKRTHALEQIGPYSITASGRFRERTRRTKSATAWPISWGLSCCRKWRPFTVTSVWFNQARQSSRCLPTRIEPGSALMNSLGTSAEASQAPHHIRGVTFNRNHSWPCERGPAVLARSSEGLTVSGHFRLTELAYDGVRQHSFNEHVLFKNQLLAAFGSETLKHTSCILGPVGPSERCDDRFHVNDALHSVAVLVGPVETHCRAPVMEHQDNLVAQADLFPQCKQIAALFGICVTLWTGVLELVRIAHADQIAGDQATQPFAERHDVAPEIRGSWIPVLENDCITAAVLDVGHPAAFDGGECLLPVGLFGDRHRGS